MPVPGQVAPAIAFYKSPVVMGILVSLVFKLLSVVKPEWGAAVGGMEEEAGSLLLLFISALGDIVAFIGRVGARLQPVKFVGGSDTTIRVHPLAVVMLLALALGGCVTTNRAVVTQDRIVVVPANNAVDRAIERVSPEVAQYCTLIRTALQLGQFVATNPRHVQLVTTAVAAVNGYCAAPPRNVAEVLRALSEIWIEIHYAGEQYASLRGVEPMKITVRGR